MVEFVVMYLIMSSYSQARLRGMHPKISTAVPNSPEASAMLSGQRYRPLTFGGLVTKLVEQGDVYADGYDTVRTGVCNLLGITLEDFTENMRDPRLVSVDVVDGWTSKARRNQVTRVREARKQFYREHLDTTLEKGLPIKNTQKLQEMVAAQEAAVADAQQQLDELGEGAPLFRRNILTAKLNYQQAILESQKASGYAIRLPDLLRFVCDSEPMFSLTGHEFRRHVLLSLGDTLVDKTDRQTTQYQPLDFFYGEQASWYAEDAEAFENTWLTGAEATSMLTDAYSSAYFNVASPDELHAQDPVSRAFYLPQEELERFNEHFPPAARG